MTDNFNSKKLALSIEIISVCEGHPTDITISALATCIRGLIATGVAKQAQALAAVIVISTICDDILNSAGQHAGLGNYPPLKPNQDKAPPNDETLWKNKSS